MGPPVRYAGVPFKKFPGDRSTGRFAISDDRFWSEPGGHRIGEVQGDVCSWKVLFMLVKQLKCLGLLASVVAGITVCSPLAQADSITQFDFSFSSSDKSVSGSGILNVAVNNDGISYTATSGSITLPDPTVSNTSSGFVGTFALDSGLNDSVYSSAGLSPDGKNYVLSSDGYFYFDDQLYFPQPNNADLSGFLLDVGGLLFTNGSVSSPQEINLYQSGSYVYYENNGNNEAVSFELTPMGKNASVGGSAAVPLPSAAGVGLSMFAVLAVCPGLRKRLGGFGHSGAHA
jgi:hypothetical protein